MVTLIRCVCGNALDVDHLDLVMTVRCPVCKRELNLEFAGPDAARRRCVLRVVEGPMLAGQACIVPIREDLVIGGEDGCWLLLPHGHLGAAHCRLRVDRHGVATITDLKSQLGTWIEQSRIIEGVLNPGQDLRVGAYRLRYEIQDIEELKTEAVVAKAKESGLPEQVPLVMLKPVDADETPLSFLVKNRFVIVRATLLGFAWVVGIYHFLYMRYTPGWEWPWYFAVGPALAAWLPVLIVAGKVSLAAPRWNIAAIVVTALLAAFDAGFGMLPPAIASALLAISTAGMTLAVPKDEHAIGATVIGGAGLMTILIVTMAELSDRLPAILAGQG